MLVIYVYIVALYRWCSENLPTLLHNAIGVITNLYISRRASQTVRNDSSIASWCFINPNHHNSCGRSSKANALEARPVASKVGGRDVCDACITITLIQLSPCLYHSAPLRFCGCLLGYLTDTHDGAAVRPMRAGGPGSVHVQHHRVLP